MDLKMVGGWTGVLAGLLLMLVCALLVKSWWSGRRYRRLGNLIPGPPTLPLIGNLHQANGGSYRLFCLLREMMAQHHGHPFRLWLGSKLYVVITTAEDAEILLVKERLALRDKYMMKVGRAVMGNGVLTCGADSWKRQRKIIAPTFGTRIVESYLGVFNKQARILTKHLERFANGNTFDIYELLGLCTFDSVCESTMGIDMKSQQGNNSALAKSVLDIVRIVFERFIKPWLMFDCVYNLTALARGQKNFVRLLHEASDAVIRNKLRAHLESKSLQIVCGEEEEFQKRKSFLDHLISSSEKEGASVLVQQMKDEVHTIMLTGLETTATTLCFVLLMLSLHPERQEEVHQELREVFADQWERPVTADDIKQLQRLDRVIKETMRLFPAAGFFTAREVSKELELTSYTIPAGCTAAVPSYIVQRDPRYFPDPERFDPDRFLPERSQGRHPYSYIPFGAGPRMCIGYKYAEVQMAATLATVLRRFRVLPAVTFESLQHLEISIVIRPVCGYKLKMVPR